MIRRHGLGLIAGMLAASAGLCLRPAQADTPAHRVSATQIRYAVAQRFPLRYPVGGLFDVAVQTPVLRFMAADNRLGAQAAVEAGGPALRRQYPGTLDVDFALRYEPSDMTLRAHQIRLIALQMDGLPPQAQALLDAYAPALARQFWAEVVLHTLQPQDLALPNAMGLQPGAIDVVVDGLVIRFTPRS